MPDDPDINSKFVDRDIPLAPETGHPKEHLMRRIGHTLDTYRAAAPEQFRDVLLLGGNDHYPEMIRHMLAGKGFDFIATPTPSDLERRAKASSTAVAIVDSDSTDWSPSAALGIPVIALTTDRSPEAASTLRSCGYAAVIKKPFIPDEFLAILRKYTTPTRV